MSVILSEAQRNEGSILNLSTVAWLGKAWVVKDKRQKGKRQKGKRQKAKRRKGRKGNKGKKMDPSIRFAPFRMTRL